MWLISPFKRKKKFNISIFDTIFHMYILFRGGTCRVCPPPWIRPCIDIVKDIQSAWKMCAHACGSWFLVPTINHKWKLTLPCKFMTTTTWHTMKANLSEEIISHVCKCDLVFYCVSYNDSVTSITNTDNLVRVNLFIFTKNKDHSYICPVAILSNWRCMWFLFQNLTQFCWIAVLRE
jgi:hypothetical protein